MYQTKTKLSELDFHNFQVLFSDGKKRNFLMKTARRSFVQNALKTDVSHLSFGTFLLNKKNLESKWRRSKLVRQRKDFSFLGHFDAALHTSPVRMKEIPFCPKWKVSKSVKTGNKMYLVFEID